MLLHATGVARDGQAALLTGPSGAGKSDLALRLIDRGWTLLADDYVELERDTDGLYGVCPASTAGLIEVYGIGIAHTPHIPRARVILCIDLVGTVERMPPPATCAFLQIALPCLALDPWSISAPIKVEHAFARVRAALSVNGP